MNERQVIGTDGKRKLVVGRDELEGLRIWCVPVQTPIDKANDHSLPLLLNPDTWATDEELLDTLVDWRLKERGMVAVPAGEVRYSEAQVNEAAACVAESLVRNGELDGARAAVVPVSMRYHLRHIITRAQEVPHGATD